MLRLSIQARQALAKLSLPMLFAASLGVMLVGRTDPNLAERARMWLADGISPIYASIAAPVSELRRGVLDVGGFADLADENRRLRQENARLRRWYDVALALETENATLKENLHWIPDPAPSYVTGRVVADAGGIYSRAALLYLGPNSEVHRGEIALDAKGLVGRVTELGQRSARILLLTDQSSRIPVELPGRNATGIMVGTNTALPRLLYLPDGVRPTEGERVVTSAKANAFPAGLPVGTIHLTGDGEVTVVPAASLDELSIVRLYDYNLQAIRPPPAGGRAAFPAGPGIAAPEPAAATTGPQAALPSTGLPSN